LTATEKWETPTTTARLFFAPTLREH